MKEENENILAFIKYQGKLVESGYLDARKSGEVLLGIDELLKFFITKENPELQEYDFEIPVKVRKGSWETIIPEHIDSIALPAFLIWMAGKYAGSALEEIAKNDFKDVSFKEIFKQAFKNIINVIKLATHLSSINVKKFENVKFSDHNDSVQIRNDKGEELWIPFEVLELYTDCPQNIFNKLSKIVEEDRELSIGLNDNGVTINEKITTHTKYIFSKIEEENDTFILPELVHGNYVELEGHITRGNEKSNTIGFLYGGHIITCFPESGNIKSHKNNMFSSCVLKGYVDRLDKDGKIKEKKPRVKFTKIVPKTDNNPKDLFN